jgi:hypothetical protein
MPVATGADLSLLRQINSFIVEELMMTNSELLRCNIFDILFDAIMSFRYRPDYLFAPVTDEFVKDFTKKMDALKVSGLEIALMVEFIRGVHEQVRTSQI